MHEQKTTPYRVGSVCAGVGGFDYAFHMEGLGETVWALEIDGKARDVFSRHFPAAQMYEDLTKWEEYGLEPVDVICGGTPCQSFSVAGKRGGLSDERGNLALRFVELCDAYDPDWIVWENVPGVLSSKDNAFGCFLAGLAGEEEPLVPPRGKWANAGVVVGPKRAVAWRVLDAQHFGVPQRRRRVIAVASPRAGVRGVTEILFEPKGVSGDPAAGREAGKDAPAAAGSGPEGCGARAIDVRNMRLQPDEVSGTLQAKSTGGHSLNYQNPVVTTSTCQNTGHGWWNGSEVGATVRTPNGGGSLEANVVVDGPVIPLQEISKRTGKSTDDPRAGIGIGTDGDPMYTLQAGAQHRVGAADVCATLQASGAGTSRPAGMASEADFLVADPDVTPQGYRMAAFGQYEDDGTASTLKMRDYKDATDLVVEPSQTGYTVHGEHSTTMTGDGDAQVTFPTDRARCLDTTGGYATSQGGTIVTDPIYQCGHCGEGFQDKFATGAGTMAPAECPRCGEEADITELNPPTANTLTTEEALRGPRGDGNDNLVVGYFSPRCIRNSDTSNETGIKDGRLHDTLQSDGPGAVAYIPHHDEHDGRGENFRESDTSPTLRGPNGTDNTLVVPDVTAFQCKDSGDSSENIAPTLRAMNHDQSHINGGGQVAVVVPEDPAAFDMQQVTSVANRQRIEPGRPCPTLHQAGGAHVIESPIVFHPTQDPISNEGVSHALGVGSKQRCATAAVAYDLRNGTEDTTTMSVQAGGMGEDRGLCPNAIPHVVEDPTVYAFTERTRKDGRNLEYIEDQSYALTNPGAGGRAQERCIAHTDTQPTFGSNPAPTGGGQPPAVAYGFSAGNSGDSYGIGLGENVSPPCRAGASGTNQAPTVAYGIPGTEVGFALRATPSHSGDKGDGGVNTTLVQQPVPFTEQAGTVCAEYGRQWNGNASAENGSLYAQQGMTVRRLIPMETERLQGFPDGWTTVGASGAIMADSTRYKMMGNAVATPVIRWVARRIRNWVVSQEEQQ